MSSIELRFTVEGNRLSLSETRFRLSAKSSVVTARRGSGSSLDKCGTFSWSSAVKGLCVLLLRHQDSEMAGEKGSLAASLDYALSKKPLWLSDMFGVTSQGDPLAARLIHRRNPERKLGPTVWLSLGRPLREGQIKVFLNGVRLSSPEQVSALAARIDDAKARAQTGGKSAGAALSDWLVTEPDGLEAQFLNSPAQSLQERLSVWIYEEITRALFDTDVFTKKSIETLQGWYGGDTSLTHFLGKCRKKLEPFFTAPPTRERLALSREIQEDLIAAGVETVRVSSTIAQVGTLALFYYLKKRLSLPVEIQLNYAHTPAILRNAGRKTVKSCFSIFTLALGATITKLKSRGDSLSPLMLSPGVSYRVISNRKEDSPNDKLSGNFRLFKDEMSTSYYYFHSIQGSERFRVEGEGLACNEPDEILRCFVEEKDEASAMVWFPHYHIHSLLQSARTVLALEETTKSRETFLFSDENGARSPEAKAAFRALLRDAWLELRVDPQLRFEIAKTIASDPGYYKNFLRITGVHSYLPKLSPAQIGDIGL